MNTTAVAPAGRARQRSQTRLGKAFQPFWDLCVNHSFLCFVVWLILAALLILVTLAKRSGTLTGTDLTRWAAWLSVASDVLIVFIVAFVVRLKKGKLSSLIIGKDLRTSTSKTQYLLWTIGVAAALSYIAMHTLLNPTEIFVCTKAQTTNCAPGSSTWEQYLILLGVPAAAAIVASAATTYKVQNQIIQKTNATTTSVGDIATDDSGNPDLIDIQYLIFNIIAFLYFAVNFIGSGTFVSMPYILLGLTSVAAATYSLNKAISANRPIIQSVSPGVIAAGTEVTIKGLNLFPTDDKYISVTIGGQTVNDVESQNGANQTPSSSADIAVFTAPGGMRTDQSGLTVTTTASVQSDSYPVTIVAPSILGWDGDAPTPGSAGSLRVAGLPKSDSDDYGLLIDSSYVEAHRVDDQRSTTGELQFQVPQESKTASPVTATVTVDGVQVATGHLQLTAPSP